MPFTNTNVRTPARTPCHGAQHSCRSLEFADFARSPVGRRDPGVARQIERRESRAISYLQNLGARNVESGIRSPISGESWKVAQMQGMEEAAAFAEGKKGAAHWMCRPSHARRSSREPKVIKEALQPG